MTPESPRALWLRLWCGVLLAVVFGAGAILAALEVWRVPSILVAFLFLTIFFDIAGSVLDTARALARASGARTPVTPATPVVQAPGTPLYRKDTRAVGVLPMRSRAVDGAIRPLTQEERTALLRREREH